LNERITSLSGSIESIDIESYVEPISAKLLTDEYVIAQAFNDVNRRILDLSGNSGGGESISSLSAAVVTISSSTITELSAGTVAELAKKSNTGHTHAIGEVTNLQTTLDGKSNTGHSHSEYALYANVTSLSSATVSTRDTLTAHTGDTSVHVPSHSSSDSGKVLSVNSNGNLVWITPVSIYTGSGEPAQGTGNDGDIYLQTS
jgi:hypothetical protein